MTRAYLFMAAGLVSFASMGIVHKLGDRAKAQPLGIAMFAMMAAAVVTFGYTWIFQENAISGFPARGAVLALPFGASAAIALWLFQTGLRFGHIATSWLLINLSAGVPTLLSLIFYHERLNWKKAGIFGLVIISLLLLWWDRRVQMEASSE